MRPLRLELGGFTTYREGAVVEFEGADYFALVGPTGSGKSSVIDAMTFALYGAIPRLDLRSVAPVIAQGVQEARVRLDFAIGDERFTAVRVVRRMGDDRATTKEARLERGDDVLAGNADEVTAEVERRLGLSFEEFTRCVVLPQGEFARFMHDKPADRRDLLVRLLDMEVYGRIGQRANQRATESEARLGVQRQRLEEDLASATEEALADMRARIAGLEAVEAQIEQDEPRLEELRDAVRGARAEAAEARQAADALAAVAPPVGIAELGAELAGARAHREAADAALASAEDTLRTADEALAALPDRAPLAAALDAHAQRDAVVADLATADEAVATLERDATSATQARSATAAAVTQAEAALEEVRVAHRAADLARTLVTGEPCPVCGQEVHELPHVDVPAALDDAERRLGEARVARDDAAAAEAAAQKVLAAATGRVATLRDTLEALEERVAQHRDAGAVRVRLAEIDAAEAALKQARAAEAAARRGAAEARVAVDRHEAALTEAWTELAEARDRMAAHGPPALAREDLAGDWEALTAWATERATQMRTAADHADARAAASESEGSAIVRAHRTACTAAGVEEVGSPRDDCLKALALAREHEQNIAEALERAVQIREEVAALEERAAVAKALGLHMRSNAFEEWVLRHAFTVLVDGATRILLELSGGQYSMALDRRGNFTVIDHRNADAQRTAKTLSGGETFLASLALALAMSDRIASLSANSAVRLESIFLDEGFGALDPETLEVVRAAIENLAARRTVGIVTHVRALAEEVPVRFEVRKGPETSTIEKVLA